MALRAIPNLWYVRPGDANETAMAWRLALEREGGPVALALSRQKLPTLDRSEVAPAEGVASRRVRALADGDGEPDVILLATGSEVRIASRPRGRSRTRQRPRRLDAVLGALRSSSRRSTATRCCRRTCGARLSVEAGITLGWERWVGDQGASVGVDRFGASAPYTRIYEELGLTSERVAAEAAALLQRVG